MDTRRIHVEAGDIDGLILDRIEGSVDGMAMGATRVGTINGNQAQAYGALFGERDKQFSFYPFIVYVLVTEASAVLAVPTLSLGTNGPSYDNILGNTQLPGLTTAGKVGIFLPAVGGNGASFGMAIYANVTSAGAGGSLMLRVSLVGVFQVAP